MYRRKSKNLGVTALKYFFAFQKWRSNDRIWVFKMELTLAITGASGTIYAHRTLCLLAASRAVETVNLIMSDTAATVAQVEMGANLRDPDAAKINAWLGLEKDSKLIRYWRLDNFAAKPSSGSNKQAGMIIVPCSMGTMGAIASGAGTNLIHRAADVCLKEGRKLVLVPRETPYNAIHLENMLKLVPCRCADTSCQPGVLSPTENDR
jgi:4-hydroxy-3-polyprenylbenzoate decarboxylase